MKAFAILAADIDASVRKGVHNLIGPEKRSGIACGDIHDRAGHRLLSAGGDIDIDPKTNAREQDRQNKNRNANARHTDAAGLERDQLAIRRHATEHQKDRGEKTPRNREGQRKWQHERHESQNG